LYPGAFGTLGCQIELSQSLPCTQIFLVSCMPNCDCTFSSDRPTTDQLDILETLLKPANGLQSTPPCPTSSRQRRPRYSIFIKSINRSLRFCSFGCAISPCNHSPLFFLYSCSLINPIYPELSLLFNTASSFAVKQLSCVQVFLDRTQSITVVAHDSIHQAEGPYPPCR
jgi:hypothetical protein